MHVPARRSILGGMSDDGQLGSPPAIGLEVVVDHGVGAPGFLRVRSLQLRCSYPDGTRSEPFPYQVVERDAIDAVAIVLWGNKAGTTHVCLRSQLRPPLAFREGYQVPLMAHGQGPVQWEVPAGLIEPGERGLAGVRRRAAAEAFEEVGMRLDAAQFEPLGKPTSLSPGMCGEKLHFMAAEVQVDAAREAPAGDGHALEDHNVVRFVPLEHALHALESEHVHDIKTEVALHRLARMLDAGAAG